jgi:hypothetical protein
MPLFFLTEAGLKKVTKQPVPSCSILLYVNQPDSRVSSLPYTKSSEPLNP